MKDYFAEIVGYEDIKRELRVISDMLNNPELYKKMGARFNNGLMLVGDPGTGKTTMANCLIKSTNRTAFICRKKASDGKFVDQIVDVFDKAQANAPSIVLLDDLDKFSDDDEDCDAEEFVAVQACIDDAKGKDVFVMATVNNARKLPWSLTRPGRLGKRLKVQNPEGKEAEDIIRYYLDKLEMCENLDVISIARMLNDESCATLENVISCAAMKAAFNRQEKVTMENVVDACLDMVFEAPESSKKLSEETMRKIAYHEAGHVVVAELLDPHSVSIASIRPTAGGDYGFARYFRSTEKIYTNVDYNECMIKTSLAGRAAIDIVYGVPDVGTTGDMQNAFFRARVLVGEEGICGFDSWLPRDHYEGLSTDNRNRTVAMLVEKQYEEAKKLLAEHRDLLDKMANALMQKTTLTYSDVQKIMAKNKH